MTGDRDRTFRLGDRVRRRVELRATAHRGGWGDIIGFYGTATSSPMSREQSVALVAWADGSQAWESPIELRLAAER